MLEALSGANFGQTAPLLSLGLAAYLGAASIAILCLSVCAVSIDRRWNRRPQMHGDKLLEALNQTQFGLTMFDDAGRLVLSNKRHMLMYGLTEGLMKPGMTFADILSHEVSNAAVLRDQQAMLAWHRHKRAAGKLFEVVLRLKDGRAIVVTTMPTADGGWAMTHLDVTERYTQAKELSKVRKFLDTIIEHVPAPIIVRDAKDARCVLINRAAEETTTRRREQVLGKPFEAFYDEPMSISLRIRESEVVCSGMTRDYPERIVETRSGPRALTSKKIPVFGDKGEVRYVLTIMNDVTEHNRQTRELSDVKSFLDMVIENVPASIVVRNAEDSRFVLVNRATEELFGISREQIIGKHPSEVYSAGAAARVAADDKRQLETGKPLIVAEQLFEMPAKGLRTISSQRLPVTDGTGQIKYLLSVVEDITDRTRQTKDLADVRTFLGMVIENVPVSILVKDADDLRYILMNRTAENLYGISRDEMIGKTALDVYPEATATLVTQHDEDLRVTRTPMFIPEQPFETPGRGTRIVSATRLPVLSEDGELRYLLTVVEDMTERKQAEARMAHMADHDPLTDLPNRAAFNACFAATLERASAENDSFAILCVDLDRFKEVNDVFGHSTGDTLLCKVGQALQKAVGDAFIARLGGDEFAVIMAGEISPANVAELGERLLEAVTGAFDVDGRPLRVGLSVGIALYPNDGADTTALLANADAALYRAKVDGRGSMRFFEPDMDKRLREHRALAHDLRSAIARGEIHLNYQPQAHLDRQIIGFEALARWQHPTRGFVSPVDFIPLAEESGFILELGEWVLREACREAASWPKPLHIAVNISAVQFRHGDLVSLVHAVLLETGLDPARLELEVTESVLIDDLSRALSILRRLKTLGVRIAMDDFGTGYSSLSNLQSFAFDKIKIDKSFIMNLKTNPQSATIVRAVIGLGRGLDLPVLAEGVETKAQLDFLIEEQCAEVQGYLIGKPLIMDAYAEVVGRPKPRRARRSVG